MVRLFNDFEQVLTKFSHDRNYNFGHKSFF